MTEGSGNILIVYIQDSNNPPVGVASSLGVRYLIEDIVAREYSELPQDRQLPLVPLKVQILDQQSAFTVHLKFKEFYS